MTSFLFIPAAHDRVGSRRVDFGNIGALFAESEEPAIHRNAWRGLVRLCAALALVLLAIGDTLTVTHSVAFGSTPVPHRAALRATF